MRGWVFPAFVIQNLWVVHDSLAEKNVQRRLLHQYMCVGLCVSSFVIQNLWVCTMASLEEMYSVGYCTSICVCGWMFPAFVIQNLWVCSVASLQKSTVYVVAVVYVCVAGCLLPL